MTDSIIRENEARLRVAANQIATDIFVKGPRETALERLEAHLAAVKGEAARAASVPALQQILDHETATMERIAKDRLERLLRSPE